MLGSLTTPSRPATCDDAAGRVAFQAGNPVGARENATFAAQWPACTILCRRFALPLAGHDARLEGDVTRWVFIVEDFHLLLLAGLPAHYPRAQKLCPTKFRLCSPQVRAQWITLSPLM